MPKNAKIEQSLELLAAPERLQKIGSAVVRQAVAHAVAHKVKTGQLRPNLKIEKGEVVPKAFRDAFHIAVDEAGRAKEAWPRVAADDGDYFEVCYGDDGGGYPECYYDCWSEAVDFVERINQIARGEMGALRGVSREQLAAAFSPKEVELLGKYGILPKT